MDVHAWHASLRRGEAATAEETTGEVRLPLRLFNLDEPQGDVGLVLSRPDVRELHAYLGHLLSGGCPQFAVGGRP